MAVGVQVRVLPTEGGQTLSSGDPRTVFLVGLAERGDTTAPVLLRSAQEAAAKLGNRVPYGVLRDQAEAAFGEAGDTDLQVYALRVVGAAATTGQVNLLDGAAVPVQTLRLAALSAGAHSADITYQVTAGSQAGTFTLTIGFRGQVEVYRDLASPAAAQTALLSSSFVRGTDLGSVTAAPANNPALVGPLNLPAGTEDRASVTAATQIAAANTLLPKDLGPGLIAIPGQPHSAVGAGLAAHAETTGRIALTAPPIGSTLDQARTAARSLRSTTGAKSLGLVYPWVGVPDGAGGTKTISGEGAAAGLRARLGKTYQAPAGERGQLRYVTSLERTLSEDDLDLADSDAVSGFRIAPSGPQLFGWRSLSLDELNFAYLSYQDLVNEVAFSGKRALQRYPFQSIDSGGKLFAAIDADLTALLQPIADDGGLFRKGTGADADPGYKIDTSPAVNTPQSIALGRAKVRVSLRPSPIGGLVIFELQRVPFAANL